MLDYFEQLSTWLKLAWLRLGEAAEALETYVAWLATQAESVFKSYLPADERTQVLAILAVMALTLILVWRVFRRRRSGVKGLADLSRVTRRPRLLGYMSGVILLAAVAGWASVAKLSSAALAPGVVSPDGHRKTIQHLEGGIVKTIHVREGDIVIAGDTLVSLDVTQALARHRELRERYADLLSTESRLVAEQTGSHEMTVPAELKGMTDIVSDRAIADQIALLSSRRTAREGREKIFRQRILQVEEEITGLGEMIAAQDLQLELIDREIEGVQKLFDKGLERLPRILALQRAKAQIDAEKAANRARVARDGQEIGETQMQLIAMRDDHNERVNEELTKTRGALAELRSQLVSRKDILARTEILAPVPGTVMNMRITTETGVIRPGDSILDIVPSDARLIIDAHVKPADIDNVQPGMKTRVLLTAYRQRNLPLIHGVLRSVSADILFDERSGSSYFLAKVEVEPGVFEKLEGVRLMPGMPAEVMILNREQTLLHYMIDPLSGSMARSFREN